MVGIDIVKISRIKNLSSFKNKILSKDELSLYIQAHNKKEFIAGRFAAKEAFLKANHKGIGEIPMKDIKVVYNARKAPIIKYKRSTYDVSISHDGDYAIAIVII